MTEFSELHFLNLKHVYTWLCSAKWHTLHSGVLTESCNIDLYNKSVHRISINNKLHKPAITLQTEATSFVPNRTFSVYIFTITTLYVPAEE